MDYLGEHLLPGQLGHFLIVLSLVASLAATFAYFKSTVSKQSVDAGYWKRLARYAFIIEAISVASVIGLLYYINSSHLFEYKYAWQHSSRTLEPKYLLASIWEGQEGSFLLWSIWHCVLGLILIKTSKQWEGPVMTVVSFAQFLLATMIVGIYFFGEKLGSNPFILLRDSGVLDNAHSPACIVPGFCFHACTFCFRYSRLMDKKIRRSVEARITLVAFFFSGFGSRYYDGRRMGL